MAGEKIRVLIVDDVAETRENIKKLLQFEGDVEVVGTARSGKEAIQISQELDPDVALMDINMPDMDGISATESIRQKSPHIQVIILSVQGDQNYMRRAMLAGARDFLTKPPMGDELISAIRRAGEMARAERSKMLPANSLPNSAGGAASMASANRMLSRGKVITVYSPKGGVGTTTVAVNLSLALHNDDTRVVIVDANLQYGDVAVFFNEQGRNTIADLAQRSADLDVEIVESVLMNHTASGVNILAAPSRPEQADKVSSEQFLNIIDFLRQLYAYVVVDTSSFLSDVAVAAIDVSDVIVLLTNQDIPAIKNARLFLDLLQTLGVPRDRILFAMNKFDKRINITAEKIGENLKQEVAAILPLDDRVVIPAVNRGIPFMVDGKAQPIGRAILALAEKIRARVTELDVDGEKLLKR